MPASDCFQVKSASIDRCSITFEDLSEEKLDEICTGIQIYLSPI